MKPIKVLLLTVFVLPAVALIALIIWLSSVSPTRFLPLVEKQLLKYNIEAHFSGDASWSLYPNIGVKINQLSFRQRGDTSAPPLGSVGIVHFSLKLIPLVLRKDVLINGIYLADVDLSLQIDDQGRSNWQKITVVENPPIGGKVALEGNRVNALPRLEVAVIDIAVNQLIYNNAQTQRRLALEKLHIRGNGLNFNGSEFDYSAEFSARANQLPSAGVSIAGSAVINHNHHLITVPKLNANFRPSGSKETVRAALQANVSYRDSLQAKGNFQVESFNFRELFDALDISLPNAANPDSYTYVSVDTPFEFIDNQVALTDSLVNFDKSAISGITKIKLSSAPRSLPIIRSHWTIDEIDFDSYLPPPHTSQTAATSPANSVTAAPTASSTKLSFERLNQVDLASSLSISGLTYQGETFEHVKLSLSSGNGLTSVSASFSRAYDGTVNFQGRLDTTTKLAQIEASGEAQQLNLGKLASSFAGLNNIDGHSTVKFQAKSRGMTKQDLRNNFEAIFNLDAPQLKLTPINLEKQYCRALSVLEDRAFNHDGWENVTMLSPLSLNIQYRHPKLNVKNLTGQLHTLATHSDNGSFDLSSGEFLLPIKLSLRNADQNSKRCRASNAAFQDKFIPIICKGNLETLSINTCLPDLSTLKTLAAAKIEKKVKSEQDKLEQTMRKKRDEAQTKALEKIEEQGGKLIDKDTGNKLENAWKNLIKKN